MDPGLKERRPGSSSKSWRDMKIHLFALAATVLLLAGCDPIEVSKSSASQSPEPPPVAAVQPLPGLPVWFKFETYEILPDGREVQSPRKIQVTITGYGIDGKPAVQVASDGTTTTEPLVLESRPTPYMHKVTLGPGIENVAAKGYYLGRNGDSLQCYIVGPNGLPIRSSVVRATVVGGPNGLGSAEVNCGPITLQEAQSIGQ